MQGLIKSGVIIFAILAFNSVVASANPVLSLYETNNVILQQDSLRISLLVNALQSQKEELGNNPADSLEIFKNLGLISAELTHPKEASEYVHKYIKGSADISILNKDSFAQISGSQEFQELKNEYVVKINILIFIYLYIVLIGFFFAILINFKKDSDKVSNLLIGGFVIVHSIFILDFTIYASNVRYVYPHTFLMSASIALLYGPLLYFYFKRINQQYRFKRGDLLHLLPTAVLLIILIPLYSISAQEKLNILFDISALYTKQYFFYVIFIPKLSSYIIYGVLIGRLYFNKKNKLSFPKDTVLIKWKSNIYYMHIMYLISYGFYGLATQINFSGSEIIYHSQIIAMSLTVLYIAKMAYLQPKVLHFKSFILNGNGLSKYLKSGLTPSLSEELKDALVSLLQDYKVYRDNSISLESLSEKLNTTRHNTSQIINEHFGMNFFELINKFRIEEATNLLLEDTNGNFNIIDIAYEVGYNNKVTFNKAFKKETSLTPTQFIESIKNQSDQHFINNFKRA